MARDGLGNFNLSEPPFVYDTTILEDVMNNVLSDIASGLTQSLSRDGQSLPTAPLPMGGYRHTDVGNASARDQYAAAAQVQDGTFTWCGTAGGTANALTLSPSPSIPAYAAGQQFLFSAPATNTDAVTIAVSGLSATPIQNAGAALVSGDIVAGRAYSIVYTGSAFQIAAHSLVVPVPVATESVSGISRQATIAEAKSGTSTTPAALPHVTPEGVAAAVSATRWKSRAIGEPFGIWDHLPGTEIPPTATDGPRFVKLTAGDAYNSGLLSGESVFGSAPDITATAVIALSGSPLYGQTVRLVNTERRFIRGGASGVIEGDAIRNITGEIISDASSYSDSGAFYKSGDGPIITASVVGSYAKKIGFDASRVVPTAAENRPRNISATYYLRVR